MKSAVTISLVPQAAGGPFIFWNGLEEGCVRAAALGFDGIEIFPASASDIDPSKVPKLLALHGLKVAAVGTGAGWVIHKWSLTHPDAAVREQARKFIRGIIAAAAECNAPAIIGSMQGRAEGGISRGQALDWLKEALVDLGGSAASRGQMLLCEPLNRYETNLLNNLADTCSFLRTIPLGNLKILADLFHMNVEETSLADAIGNAAPYLGHVHFADSNRRAIGLGHTEVAPVIQALSEIGYQGYLSAEALPWPDSESAARQTIESFRRYTGLSC